MRIDEQIDILLNLFSTGMLKPKQTFQLLISTEFILYALTFLSFFLLFLILELKPRILPL